MMNFLAQLGAEAIVPPGVVVGLWIAREVVGWRKNGNGNGVHEAIADHEQNCPVKDSIGQIQKDIRQIHGHLLGKQGGKT